MAAKAAIQDSGPQNDGFQQSFNTEHPQLLMLACMAACMAMTEWGSPLQYFLPQSSNLNPVCGNE